MGIYGVAEYGALTYGEAPKVAYSALPFTAEATGDAEQKTYNTVTLSWTQPQGDYNQIRLLRSQDGFPETEEDGLVLWSWYDGSGAQKLTEFVDSPANVTVPLVEGRFAYYRIWVFQTIQARWTVAGDAIVLVPRQHSSLASDGTVLVSSTDKIIDVLPRMYFSPTQSPHGAINAASTAYRFIEGFAFTLDEITTYADNLLPDKSGRATNPALLFLKTRNYGLDFENYIGTKNQKKLVRTAPYFFQYRGTIKGLSAYCEALTGFAPTLTVGPNLLLSTEDSTFYKGLGNWVTVGEITLELEQSVPGLATGYGANAIDTRYTAKVTTPAGSDTHSLRLGVTYPKRQGVPVTAGNEYSLTGAIQAVTNPAALTDVKVHWFDSRGDAISVETVATGPHAAGSWDTFSSGTLVAPGGKLPTINYSIVSNEVTLTVLGTISGWASATSFVVSNVSSDADGTHTIDTISYNAGTGVTTIVYTLSSSVADDSGLAPEGQVKVDEATAYYAGIELVFTSGVAEQVDYIDMIAFSNGAAGNFTEARVVDILFAPKKTNFLKNPSFESSGSSLWSVTAAANSYETTSLDIVDAGTEMLQVQATQNGTTSLSSDTDTIEQNKFYTFSVYAKMAGIEVTDAVLTSNVATLTLAIAPPWSVGQDINVSGLGDAYDGNYTITAIAGNDVSYAHTYPDQAASTPTGGTVCRPETMSLKLEAIDSVTSAVVYSQTSEDYSFDDVWLRYYVTTYVGSNSNPVFLRATVEGTTQGCVMVFDAAQIEIAYTPTDYFDGEFPVFYGASWAGTANQSVSYSYTNKAAKLLRVSETARNYLPLKRPYTVSSFSGREFANME